MLTSMTCTWRAGVPFRETHHISGAAVKLAEDKGCELSELTVADLAGINPLFTDDVTEVRLTEGPIGCMSATQCRRPEHSQWCSTWLPHEPTKQYTQLL